MLESVYEIFGFVGTLTISLLAIFFLIFWMAGVAGICKNHDVDGTPYVRLFLSILIPIYPVIWIIADMISQKKELKRL